jgi:hypothetical protein
MFRFFSPPSVENRLLHKDSLTDVLVDTALANETVKVSRPFADVRESAKPSFYEEFEACIMFLNDAKKNLNSYRNQEKKRQNLLSLLKWASLLVTSGTTFGLIFKLHQYFSAMIQEKILALLPELNHAIQERDAFMSYYNGELDRLNTVLDKAAYPFLYCDWTDRDNKVGRLQSLCWDIVDIAPSTQHAGSSFVDVCALVGHHNDKEECNQLIQSICEAQKEFFSCADGLYAQLPQAQQAAQQFQENHAAQRDEFDQSVNHLQSSVDQLTTESTWEPTSTTLFAVTASIFVGLSIYLYKNWRNAYHEYQQDLARPHALHACLKNPKHLTRIINLTTDLDMSLKDVPLEILIDGLEARKAEVAFLDVAKRYGVPPELSQDILNIADSIAPSRRRP